MGVERSLLNFSFSLPKKQKIVADVVSVEDDGRESEDVPLCASLLVPPVEKVSDLVLSQGLSCLTHQAT